MSRFEVLAWLRLLGMCPGYTVYFALQLVQPAGLTTTPQRLACLAAVAGLHALIVVTGLLLLRRGGGPVVDERDRIIDVRATRIAYFALMVGVVVVGMVMPFNQGGWDIVNAALFVVVLAEAMRNILILTGYRGSLRLAH